MLDYLSIRPRTARDRGGYICCPLKSNIPVGRENWTLTNCPECGAECWRSPLTAQAEASGAVALCTMCALRKGAGKAGTGYA